MSLLIRRIHLQSVVDANYLFSTTWCAFEDHERKRRVTESNRYRHVPQKKEPTSQSSPHTNSFYLARAATLTSKGASIGRVSESSYRGVLIASPTSMNSVPAANSGAKVRSKSRMTVDRAAMDSYVARACPRQSRCPPLNAWNLYYSENRIS